LKPRSKSTIRITSFAMCMGLSACGGSSNEAPPLSGGVTTTVVTPPVVNIPVTPVQISPEGVWTGPAFTLFISFTGRAWALDMSTPNPVVYYGILQTVGNDLSGTLTPLAGAGADPVVSGIIVEAPKGLTLEQQRSGTSVSTDLSYSDSFLSSPSLSLVAGVYDLSTGESIVVESTGVVRSTDPDCAISGGVQVPWSDRNVYSLGFQFGPSPCPNPNAGVEGILAPLSSGEVFAVGRRHAPDNVGLVLSRRQ